jgi:hypothetical protein
MTHPRRGALIGSILAACLFPACYSSQPVAQCDCSIFPPKLGCDTTCGIATGVVESVSGNSVTIKVPVIQTPSTPQGTAGPTESATVQRRTFTLNPADAAQMANVKPGSHVALTFQREQGQQVVKSIQPVQPPTQSAPKTEAHP